MPSLNPLLDTPTPTPAAPTPQEPSQPAEAPNLLFGVLRRWPWLALGLCVGLVLGLLFHMQRAPVYQSTSQVMVVKNRPDMIAGGAGDTRVQYLEDYVAPQVIILTSEIILRAAAENFLDKEGPFESPPPAALPERVGFMKARFSVAREKETGSNTPSNVLVLSFRSPHPADAPKYLRAIIAAFTQSLTGRFEDASERNLKQLDTAIDRIKKAQGDTETLLKEATRNLRGQLDPATGAVLVPGISQEDPLRVQQRVSDNRTAQLALERERIVVEQKLKVIREAGKTRAERLTVMTRLGVQPERPSLFGDLRDPESMLAHLKYKKQEAGVRLGPGHPSMISLTGQIKALEEELEKRGGPTDDELERYRRKLENDQAGIAAQLEVLTRKIDADEDVARRMAPLQQDIRNHEAKLRALETELETAKREKDRVTGTRTTGGFEIQTITKPSDGVQVAPVLMQSLLLGAVVGLMLGGGLGLRAELADRSFKSPADIRRRLGLPILGHVPLIRGAEPAQVKPVSNLDPMLAVFLRPKSAEAEAIRGIRTQLLFSINNRDHQVIQITSPNAGDGKSTIAANLAIALARANKRVVLVDCDLHKPRVHKLFGLADPPTGMATIVADQSDLGDGVQTCEIENLSLLPCGPRPASPSELLTSPRFQEVLADLRASYDYVVLDTPPVRAVTDPMVVAPRADGVILVFRMTADAGPNAERAKEELTAVSGRILGVVVNASSSRDMGDGYGYGYQYTEQYSDSYTDQKK